MSPLPPHVLRTCPVLEEESEKSQNSSMLIVTQRGISMHGYDVGAFVM